MHNNIGLKDNEYKVYEYLIKNGLSPIGPIVSEFKKHPQTIYRIINSLKNKRFVIEEIKDSQKYFKPESPENVLQSEQTKIQKMAIDLNKLASLAQLSNDAIVNIDRGNQAVIDLRSKSLDKMKSGKTYYVMGASGDRFFEIVKNDFEKIEKKRVEKKINIKYIAFINHKEMIELHNKNKKYAEFKYINQDFHVPSSTNIYNNTVAIIIWSYNPIVITINSKQVADSYRQYFDIVWNS